MGIIHLLVANGTFGLSCYLLCICNLCICICAFVLVHLYLCICICVSVLVYLYLANRTLGLSRSPLILLEGFVVSNCLSTRVNQIILSHVWSQLRRGKCITRSVSNIRFNGKTGALPPGQYLPFKTSCRSTSTNPSEMIKGAEMQKQMEMRRRRAWITL